MSQPGKLAWAEAFLFYKTNKTSLLNKPKINLGKGKDKRGAFGNKKFQLNEYRALYLTMSFY
jgi:hypothetical protein